MDILENQKCPMCNKDTLTMTEDEREIPFFGNVYLYSMDCDECKYHKADLECAETHEPAKYSVDVSSEEDLKIRIVKSGEATVKIPHITTITPGPASNGYVTNVEGVLNRVKKAIESARDDSEDEDEKKRAKNMLKKLQRVIFGQETLKIIIEDPTGNSAIVSEKAVKEKLNVKAKKK
jgi:zinc finger protein